MPVAVDPGLVFPFSKREAPDFSHFTFHFSRFTFHFSRYFSYFTLATNLTVSLKTRYCESFFDWFRRGDEFK